MRDIYSKLDRVGRIRLSDNFFMRQFLYSEIAIAYGVVNVPDDLSLAVETGSQLCREILEPISRKFGPIALRSGFRSATVNALGARKGLQCAANERNFAYHIWDHRDVAGHSGAAACVVVPSLFEPNAPEDAWKRLAWWVQENLPYHRLTFFSRDHAFNIGWHESPRREIFARVPKPHWLFREKSSLDFFPGQERRS